MATITASISFLPKLCDPGRRRPRCPPTTNGNRIRAQPITAAILSDPFVLQLAETLEESVASTSSAPLLRKLRDASSESLLSTPWPTRKDELFRFTDTSFIKNSDVQPITPSSLMPSVSSTGITGDSPLSSITIVDGYFVDSLSNLSELPDGVFVGALSRLNSEDIMKRVSKYVSSFSGDLFWSLNGVGAPDMILVYVPEGCKVENPLYLRYISVSGSEKDAKTLPLSNPRVLVLVEKGGEIGIVEEYSPEGQMGNMLCYWTNAVMEIVLGDRAKVKHSYIQTQSMAAVHVKWTSVFQGSSSEYQLGEVSVGGKLSRHNVHVHQTGPDTKTELSAFHLSNGDQLQDLHSKIVLDHPRGFSRQLHKCIIAHSSGQAVFDGNFQVNRDAQQTDAGQLTRSLLLEPRATVNVKPNLQIIADDVKCSHGAAISDLDQNQMFYLQARGIDALTARKALIFSFAGEVIERLPEATLQRNIFGIIRKLLDPSAP